MYAHVDGMKNKKTLKRKIKSPKGSKKFHVQDHFQFLDQTLPSMLIFLHMHLQGQKDENHKSFLGKKTFMNVQKNPCNRHENDKHQNRCKT
jgi:hypothetical protein